MLKNVKWVLVLCIFCELGCASAPVKSAPPAGIIFMRHGQADHNILHTFNADPTSSQYRPVHLTAMGKAQAQATADTLLSLGFNHENLRAVYASPLPRTVETAKIMMNTLSISPDQFSTSENIIENRVGTLEGSNEDLFDKKYGKGNRARAHEYGGETDTDVAARVSVLLDQILAQCKTDTSVLLVSHGTPSSLMLKYLGREDPPGGLKTGGYVAISWSEIYAHFPKKCR